METTIVVPSATDGGIRDFYLQRPDGVVPTPGYIAADQTAYADKDFILYLPLFLTGESTQANITFAAVETALNGTNFATTSRALPVYALGNPTKTFTIDSTTLSAGDTLLIPVTSSLPPGPVNLSSLKAAMTAAAFPTPPGVGSTTPIGDIPNSSSATAQSVSPGSSPTNTFSMRITASPTNTDTQQSAASKQKITEGALAGGVVGAFIIGGLLCFLAAFCLFRRRKVGPAIHETHSDVSSHEEEPLAGVLQSKQEKSILGGGLAGWQKHLPQEKDDSALGKVFRSIFEQARIHMEGFYTANLQNTSPASIETLVKLSGDGFPRLLLRVQDQALILDGVLVRWMIHRISGRSSVEESLLPRELAEVAKRSMWDMEIDAEHDGTMAQRRPGFPQAFSQWRQLSGFLTPNVKNDQSFQTELNHKLDAGVQELDAAFSPWEMAGKSRSDRKQSLRRIFQDLSDAGYLLFTQPSVFTFDWTSQASSDSKAVNITPAVVRRSDGATVPSDGRILVQPTQASI